LLATLLINIFVIMEITGAALLKYGTNEIGMNTIDILLVRNFTKIILTFVLIKWKGITIIDSYKGKMIALRSCASAVATVSKIVAMMLIPLSLGNLLG
jgi:hypothetical protein